MVNYEHGRYIGCILEKDLKDYLKDKHITTKDNNDSEHGYMSISASKCRVNKSDYIAIGPSNKTGYNIYKCISFNPTSSIIPPHNFGDFKQPNMSASYSDGVIGPIDNYAQDSDGNFIVVKTYEKYHKMLKINSNGDNIPNTCRYIRSTGTKFHTSMDIKQLYNGAHVINSKDYYKFDGKSNVKQTLLKLSQTGVNNQKKQFEQKILKQKCNNGFKAPIWNKTSGYTVEKEVQYGYVKIFKLNNPPMIDSKTSKLVQNPPYTPIGYYNINNIDVDNNIDGFYYLTSRDRNTPVQGKIVTPGVTFEQSSSNTDLMVAFLIAEQNKHELVMVYSGANGPVVYMGSINKIMKDCNVDIVNGYINPFLGSLTDVPKDKKNQYKVYLRPDLKLDDYISANTECAKKIQSQHKILKQNYVEKLIFNANLLGTKTAMKSGDKSDSKKMYHSIYKNLDMIENYENVESYGNVESYESSIPEKQAKTNIDNYLPNALTKHLQKKSVKMKDEFNEKNNKLNTLFQSINESSGNSKKVVQLEKDQIKDNYSELQGINQKLYNLNTNIDTTSEKLSYNKTIIRTLRIFLLCLFIFMLCMIGYYGVRKAYKTKILSNLKL
jgi:hypothetical protein